MARLSGPDSKNTRRRVIAVAAIAAFLLVDAALITVALTSTPAPVAGSTAGGTSSATPTPSSTSVPVGSVPVPSLGPATRLISAFDGSSAWRMSVGSCAESDAVVEHSVDGGRTWDGFDLGAIGGLATASVLDARDGADTAHLIAFDKLSCMPTWVETSNGGKEWTAFPDRASTSWSIVASDPATTISAPGGEQRAAPCEAVVGIAGDDGSAAAAVICSDQSVYRTVDTGATWVKAITGAVAIGSAGTGYLAAAISADPTCAGYTVTALAENPAESSRVVSACVAAPNAGGLDVAISGAGDAIWMWSGNSTLRSNDGGATWE